MVGKGKIIRRKGLIIGVIFFVCQSVLATSYNAATNGNDNNSGMIGSPFATIQIKTLKQSNKVLPCTLCAIQDCLGGSFYLGVK